MKFKDKYSFIGNVVYESVSDKPSLTDESFKKECDIDFIISNFVQRGIEPPQHQIEYGKQFTSEDYMHSMNVLSECKSAYEALPAIEKERFNNSVTNFLDFVSNPDNLRESYEKGYIDPSSVNVSDVYPERYIDSFNKNTSATTQTDFDVNVATNNVVADVPANSAGPENPTQ